MDNEIQIRLLEAVGRCLRPLARTLLRAGISYCQFEEIAKIAFVRESLGGRDARGRTTNVSRVAVRTGLSRKEVARIRDGIRSRPIDDQVAAGKQSYSGHAARLLQLWHSDASYLDSNGRPLDLLFDSGDPSFSSLVRRVGGDVPSGAVRAELIAAGAVRELEYGRLKVLKRHFIPGDLGEELVVGFKHVIAPVIEGLAHNSIAPRQDAYVQRVAYSESLRPDTASRFREYASAGAADFVQGVDDWLTSNEAPPGEESLSKTRFGVGVFYFEVPSHSGDGND